MAEDVKRLKRFLVTGPRDALAAVLSERVKARRGLIFRRS